MCTYSCWLQTCLWTHFHSTTAWGRRSAVVKAKEAKVKKDTHTHLTKLREMFKQAYPDSHITESSFPNFLIGLAGIMYNEEYQIIKQLVPWPTPPFICDSALQTGLPQSSLLINKQLAELLHNIACPCCGCGSYRVEWSASTTSNTRFHLQCNHCNVTRLWSAQGEKNILDDALHVGVRMVGISPSALVHLGGALTLKVYQ